jgi:hypothetical protein
MRPLPSSYGITSGDVEAFQNTKALFHCKNQRFFGSGFWSKINLKSLAEVVFIFGGVPAYFIATFGGSMGMALAGFCAIPLGVLVLCAIVAKIHQKRIVLPANCEKNLLATEKYLEAVAEFDAKQYQINQQKKRLLEEQQRKHESFWFSLSGIQFEHFLKDLLEKSNYSHVKTTPYSGDGGIDLFAVDPEGKKVVFQCKAHSRPVSPDDVRAFFGSFKALGNKADYGVLVALSGATGSGVRFLKLNGLKLWTVKDVVAMANAC